MVDAHAQSIGAILQLELAQLWGLHIQPERVVHRSSARPTGSVGGPCACRTRMVTVSNQPRVDVQVRLRWWAFCCRLTQAVKAGSRALPYNRRCPSSPPKPAMCQVGTQLCGACFSSASAALLLLMFPAGSGKCIPAVSLFQS